MANITIWFKDGRMERFMHTGRPGGSWTKKVRYEASFVVVTDEYGRETAFPVSDVRKVESEPHYGG